MMIGKRKLFFLFFSPSLFSCCFSHTMDCLRVSGLRLIIAVKV